MHFNLFTFGLWCQISNKHHILRHGAITRNEIKCMRKQGPIFVKSIFLY